MTIPRAHLVGGAALVIALTLAACGGTPAPSASGAPAPLANAATTMPATQNAPTTQPAANPPTAAASTAPTAGAAVGGEGNGEAGGVEAALVTYTDAAQHFSIGHPGPWTQDAAMKAGVKFNGGDDSMRVEFVQPPAGVDPMVYAQKDLASLATAFAGFKEVGLAASTEVDKAIVLGFEASGTSAVTGKAFAARGDRYYMPLADGRIAVVTLVGPADRYDREGVRDIALTFKFAK